MNIKKVNAGDLRIISTTTLDLSDGFFLHCAEDLNHIIVVSVYHAGYEAFEFVTSFYSEQFDIKKFKQILSEDYYLRKINYAIQQLL